MRGISWAFRTSKPLLKKFFPLMIMFALQSLLALAVIFADNIMLGIYSEKSMAAASVVAQIQFILQQFVLGAGVGITILGSRYLDNKDVNTFKKIAVIGLVFSIAAGILLCLITFLCPQWTLSLFTNDAAIIEEGVSYLRIMSWTFIIISISLLFLYLLQSVKTMWVGMVAPALATCINILLNYALIYGNLGASELGIQGAGYATLISRGVELIFVLICILAADKKMRFSVRELFYFDRYYVSDYFRAARPSMLSGTILGIALAAQVSLLGHISSEALAANGVASIIFMMFATFGFAQGNAAFVTTGHVLDSNQIYLVKNYVKVLQLIFIGVGLLTGVLVFSTKGLMVSAYSLSPETHALALRFLTVLSISGVFLIYSQPIESGIIASSGHTAWQKWIDNVFAWLFTLLATIIGFGLRLSPTFIFSVTKVDALFKCPFNAIRCNRYKWVRRVNKD
ncbi:MAG: polysaccharide biosynthesis C-terminal domain-containing protein [Coriobacteriales bacterium]|nr:polysaccharide biosynthesis C-terminal domain-containing protein [Coriobacteriales bacterium]